MHLYGPTAKDGFLNFVRCFPTPSQDETRIIGTIAIGLVSGNPIHPGRSKYTFVVILCRFERGACVRREEINNFLQDWPYYNRG